MARAGGALSLWALAALLALRCARARLSYGERSSTAPAAHVHGT